MRKILFILLLLTSTAKAQYVPALYSTSFDSIIKIEKYIRKNYIRDSIYTVRYYTFWYKVTTTDTVFGVDLNLYDSHTIDWLIAKKKVSSIINSQATYPNRKPLTKKKYKLMNL